MDLFPVTFSPSSGALGEPVFQEATRRGRLWHRITHEWGCPGEESSDLGFKEGRNASGYSGWYHKDQRAWGRQRQQNTSHAQENNRIV